MKNIKWCLWLLLLVSTGLWLLADTFAPTPFTYFSFRAVFIQYTGVIGMVVMSAAMLLAIRPKSIEPRLNGLDKMYRLHKWLGITGLVMAVLHWWWAQGTKWMVGWGWLSRPARGGARHGLGPLEGWLHSQRGLAETLGEWAFYVTLVLIVLALVKRFPYHLFVKTHTWLAVTYLILVLHSVVLADFGYWTQPVGWLLAVSMLGGSAAAIRVLTGRVGVKRRTQGVIESLNYFPALRVLESSIRLNEGWAGHRAGQFAFVTSRKSERAHPYTIASAWNVNDPRITFITKALGDHTSRLHERLKAGMPVTVEGPYGCFDFDDEKPRQIWVGAGIGITPFIARMKQLAMQSGGQVIDLFHSTAVFEPAAIDKLTADADAAGIKLHVLVDERDGRLDGEKIRAAVPDWKSASIWFCGPPGFGQALRRDFIARGLAPSAFHQELFEMR
jgi:predicted ferric reductase